MVSDWWTLQNPVFAFYTFCAAVMLFKTILMSIFTSFLRVALKVMEFVFTVNAEFVFTVNS